MKNLSDILLEQDIDEGVLDNQDELLKKADAAVEFQALLNKYQQSSENSHNTDVMGNPLKAGDLVLYIPTKAGSYGRQTLQLGMVTKLTSKGVTLLTAPHHTKYWWNNTEPRTTCNVPFATCYKISKESI